MKQSLLYKIADHIFEQTIIAGDKPKYIPDKTHSKNPGADYHKTEKGWYLNKTNHKEYNTENDQSKVLHKNDKTITPTSNEIEYMKKYYKQDGFFDSIDFVNHLNYFSDARREAKKSCKVVGQDIQNKVHGFSGNDYGESLNAKTLANLAAWHFNLGKGDYRTNFVLGEKPNEKLLKQYAQYIKREQEVLKRSGLVTKDGKVRLFRNVGKSLFTYHEDGMNIDNFTDHIGETMQYRGSHIESWTFYPDLSWDGAKIYAEVPLEAVVASFVGRDHIDPFQHMGEKECMICSSLIHEVQLVGKDQECYADFKTKYYSDIANQYGHSINDFSNALKSITPQERQEYESLKKSDNFEDKIKMLNHKAFAPSDLNEFAKNEQNPQILLKLFENPYFNSGTLKLLAEKNNDEILKKVCEFAKKENDFQVLKKLSKSENESIKQEAQKAFHDAIDNIVSKYEDSAYEYEQYAKSSQANPDVLDAMYEKHKIIDGSSNALKVGATAQSPHVYSKTLQKILTFYDERMHQGNTQLIISTALKNDKTTTEIIDKFIEGNLAKALNDKHVLSSSIASNIAKNPKSSSKALSWAVKWSKDYGVVLTGMAPVKMAESPNINNDVLDYLLQNYQYYDATNDLIANEHLTGEMLETMSNDEHCYSTYHNCKKMMEHPNCTLKVCQNIKKHNMDDENIVALCDKHIKEKFKQVSEKISDDQPSQEDIQKMKQLFPESCKGKTLEELIILFKTLMKRGYWNNVSTGTKTEEQNRDDENEEELYSYIKKMMGE